MNHDLAARRLQPERSGLGLLDLLDASRDIAAARGLDGYQFIAFQTEDINEAKKVMPRLAPGIEPLRDLAQVAALAHFFQGSLGGAHIW